MRETNNDSTLSEIQLTLRNSQEHEVTLVLEQWGEGFGFGASDELTVVGVGPEPAAPEIELTYDALTIHCWPGSTIRLFRNGYELGGGSFARPPVPEGWDKIRKIVPRAHEWASLLALQRS